LRSRDFRHLSTILENVKAVRRRVDDALRRAGRSDVATIVAITKYATLEQTRELIEGGGVEQLGESRVQDAAKKKEALGTLASRVSWRMIGHLQRNKAKPALDAFDALDSLDTLELAARLDGELKKRGRALPVLVQVNVAGKEAQSGIEPEACSEFLRSLSAFSSLEARGLMTIAPDVEPVEETRPYFRRLKQIFDDHFEAGGVLSMGMSRDFEIAVEEGANMVRVGSLLFGR
jgi:pyridoxal phosphate enzyme (YggS family)